MRKHTIRFAFAILLIDCSAAPFAAHATDTLHCSLSLFVFAADFSRRHASRLAAASAMMPAIVCRPLILHVIFATMPSRLFDISRRRHTSTSPRHFSYATPALLRRCSFSPFRLRRH